MGPNLEHWRRPVYVRFARSLATRKFTPDHEAIVVKDLSQDIWSSRTVEPVYYPVEGLISRTLYWTHWLGRPVRRWSLEEMEITHSWASNTQQCLYTKMVFRLHVWQFESSWTSLFQWRFRKAYAASIYIRCIYEDGRIGVNWLHRKLRSHRWRNKASLGLGYLALRYSYVWLKPYRTSCLRNWKPCSGSTQWLFYVG